jgi:hypothetical protein
MLAVAKATSRQSPRPKGRSDDVSAALDPTVTSRADADRLLLTEPQVFLMKNSYKTIIVYSLLTH